MSDDQAGSGGKWPVARSVAQHVQTLFKPVPTSPSVTANQNSVAVGGDNNGSIFNITAQKLELTVHQQVARQLPSYLSNVVAKFSEDWATYGEAARRELLPEIDEKLAYNDFPPAHPIITDYLKHIGILESVYRGVEQRNDDARRMVRRRAALAYHLILHRLCRSHGLHHSQARDYARSNAVVLVQEVVTALTAEFQVGAPNSLVMHETVDLAISLIVADAVIECEVLERPASAATR